MCTLLADVSSLRASITYISITPTKLAFMERPSARKPTFSEPGLLEGLQARVTQLEHLIEQQVLDQSQQSSHGQ